MLFSAKHTHTLSLASEVCCSIRTTRISTLLLSSQTAWEREKIIIREKGKSDGSVKDRRARRNALCFCLIWLQRERERERERERWRCGLLFQNEKSCWVSLSIPSFFHFCHVLFDTRGQRASVTRTSRASQQRISSRSSRYWRSWSSETLSSTFYTKATG